MPPIEKLLFAPLAFAVALLVAQPAATDVPYPACQAPACTDPADFASYLFLAPGELPNDYDPNARGSWKYNPGIGMDIEGAWQISTGRPDVVVAVLDSGIRWGARDLARKVALNAGELPIAPGCSEQDCNGDGFVSIDDYLGTPDANGNGILDGQDLIRTYSDGVDDDGNGFVDDIAGWDFADGDNDPDDLVDYGHGTGEAEDSTGEANNGFGFPGVAPNTMFLPLKVADSFVAIGSDFAQAVVYATDRGAHVVQEALGTISAGPASGEAIDYAYRRGVPVIASAADESSRHHNFPAVLPHTIWMNSIVHGDGTIVEQEDVYDLFNGCTNHGGRAWTAISSNACSSEATGRGAGMAALLVSHGMNLVDRGLLQNYPGLDKPFSAEEIRQLFRRSAEDVNHQGEPDDLTMFGLLRTALSAPLLGLFFESERVPTTPGWDEFTGYGKPNMPALLDVRADTMPPEADLEGSIAWFDIIDPVATPNVVVTGSAAARRTVTGSLRWTLEVGCGIQPATYTKIGEGQSPGPVDDAPLGTLDAPATAAACGFDPAENLTDPDGHTVTLRLQVRDSLGNLGEDRRTLAVHHDPTQKWKVALGTSAEGSPALADVDGDGVLDIIYGFASGAVQARRGDTGALLPGFPAMTDPIAINPSPGFVSGEVSAPHEAIVGPTAADDLDGDGTTEIVVPGIEGGLYVFQHDGSRRPGFPVHTDPALSDPANRDELNDTDPGILAGPTLVDLDAPGTHPALEIVAAALDGHLYAWRHDGSPVAGFPVRIADRTKVSIDDATGKATRVASGVLERAAKLLGSPAVGDLDGDGRPEILLGSNEEYDDEPDLYARETLLVELLAGFAADLGGFSFEAGGRLYAVHPDGDLAPGGAFLPGWPVRHQLLVTGLLPTVGTGTPGAPALADLDGSGELSVAVFGTAGPGALFDPTGAPRLGLLGGVPRGFAADFDPGFPMVPPEAGSADVPVFPGLGAGSFGDITGDGLPEWVAPTAGIRKLVDVAAPARQAYGEHSIGAWDGRTGKLLPAFPQPMDDTQFLTSPAIADVDGDGVPDVIQGSGAYLVRAYRGDGGVPAGFPKFTHGWVISSPTPGDVDGDGLIEIVAATREGNLFVWDTPAPATETAIPWQGFGRDRRNTQNLSSGVSPLAAPRGAVDVFVGELQAILAEIGELDPCGYLCFYVKRDLQGMLDKIAAGKLGSSSRRWDVVHKMLPLLGPDLQLRFEAAVEAVTEGLIGEVVCLPGESRCPRRLDRATRLAAEADATSDAAQAVVLRHQAFSNAAQVLRLRESS